MPDIVGITEFIAADSSRYDTEKPYWAILGPGETLGEGIPFNNMEWETHELNLVDIRGRESEFGLKSCGFQIINHESGNLELDTPKLCQDYKQKTEVMLMSLFKANSVSCYDFCVGCRHDAISYCYPLIEDYLQKRHNIPPKGSINNVSDILWEQGPALGLHNGILGPIFFPKIGIRLKHSDVTSKSGLELLERFLSKDLIKKYNRPGYRFRIVK